MNVSLSSREKYQNLKRKSRKIVFFADDFLFCKSSFPNNLLTSNYAIYIGYMIKGGNLWYKLDCYAACTESLNMILPIRYAHGTKKVTKGR